nr:late transcription factor VLTF-4 [Wadden Sea poxvirus]
MAWSMNLCNGDNYKTLDEVRAYVKASASNETQHESLFPDNVEIPQRQMKQKKVSSNRKKASKNKKEDDEKDGEKTESACSTDNNENVNNNEEESTDNENNISDLGLAIKNIINDLKKINIRVTAISTVLEDIQASSICRQYTSINKSIDLLKNINDNGKTQIDRKKQRRTTSKK